MGGQIFKGSLFALTQATPWASYGLGRWEEVMPEAGNLTRYLVFTRVLYTHTSAYSLNSNYDLVAKTLI